MPSIKHLIRHAGQELENPVIAAVRLFSGQIDPSKVVFMTNTLTYTCNPKYISQKLKEKYPQIRIVWLTDGSTASQHAYPDNVETVPLHSLRGYREAYTAAVWVDNGIAFSSFFERRNGQIHIQTMHGSLGIKRLDGAITSREKHFWGRREIRRETTKTDYVITNSLFEEEVFHTVFWKNVPMKRLGHARTDILFAENTDKHTRIRRILKEQYGIPEENKLVLYAPTHRSGFRPDIDHQSVIQALQERFGGSFSLLLRLHTRTDYLKPQDHTAKEIFDVTDYPDIQELMLAADAGITDYSSWIFDYVNTKKPGFIYAPDLEQYNNTTGFYYPLEETPFPIATTNAELCDRIKTFDRDRYLQDADAFLNGKEAVDDGHSAERIADFIVSLMQK